MARFEFGEALGDVLRISQYVDARNIRGGHITAQELIIGGGTNGVIRSENFDPDDLIGWAIFGDGSATFGSDVTVGGDVVSGNWNGALPVALSSFDTAATVGFALDSSEGAAQFMGDVFVGGEIQFKRGSTAAITTNHNPQSGDLWIEYRANAAGAIIGLTADAFGELVAAQMEVTANGFDVTAGQFLIGTPGGGSPSVPGLAFGLDTNTGIYRHSTDVIGFAAGGGESLRIGQTAAVFSVEVRIQDGSASSPGLIFSNDNDTGIYRPTSNQLAFASGGTMAFRTSGNSNVAIVLGPDGTASTPSIIFGDDSDTGIYRRDANQISLAAGGTESIRIFASGVRITDDGSASAPSLRIGSSGNQGWYRSGGTLLLAFAGTNQLRVTSSNVALDNPSTTTNSGLPAWRHNSFGGTPPYDFLPLISSERFKDQIRDLSVKRATTILDSYRSREWKSKASADPKNIWLPGFVVEESPKTPKDLLAPLLVVVKDQNKRIAELEAKVAALT
jgi:hypothetical protein